MVMDSDSTGVIFHFQRQLSKKEGFDNRRYKNKEIADGIGVSTGTVTKLMNGNDVETLTVETVKKICVWLECSMSDLIEFKPDPAAVKAAANEQ